MKKRSRVLFIISHLGPAVLIYALFVLLPLVQSFQFSTYEWSGLSSKVRPVGFENYSRLAGDKEYFVALKNNLWLMVVCGLMLVGLSVFIAHGTRGKDLLTKFVRGTILLPHILSLVIVAIMWRFLLNPSFGLIPKLVESLGGHVPPSGILGSPSTAIWGIVVAFLWYALGFYVLLFAAGINSIPEELFEAAELDGAVGWERFRLVTWPLLWSVKRIVVTYVVINIINLFALVQLMTEGNPDRATEVLVRYMYEKAFSTSQMGYATTMGVANFLLTMILALGVLWLFRRNPEARA